MLDATIRALRLLSLPMIATSFVGAVALIYIGAAKMLVAAWDYFGGSAPPDAIDVAQPSDVFIVRALESLDASLIAFAFLAFA